MKKIGIMSMQRIVNYGSFLQAYGLKSELLAMGTKVCFLDFHPAKPIVTENTNNQSTKFRKLDHFLSKYRMHRFRKRFQNKYWPILGLSQAKFFSTAGLDVEIIGSDEVFNCLQSSKEVGYCPDLFGVNSSAKKIISYAASFGNTTWEKLMKYNKIDDISNWLKNIDSISVRDENSANIVKLSVGVEPIINIDPVLLHDFSKDSMFKSRNIKSEPYILIYAYSNRLTDKECESIKKYARQNRLKIINIGGYQKIGKLVCPSPFDIFNYFKSAKYVITDTFHGTIFSMINHATFATIIRKSKNGAYGNEEKLTYLLSLFGFQNRILSDINNLNVLLNEKIDFVKFDGILSQKRQDSINYIKENI